MTDPIRDLVLASLRLETRPADLTLHDIDVLGEHRLSLGLRACLAYELHRVQRNSGAAAKPSRRRMKR